MDAHVRTTIMLTPETDIKSGTSATEDDHGWVDLGHSVTLFASDAELGRLSAVLSKYLSMKAGRALAAMSTEEFLSHAG